MMVIFRVLLKNATGWSSLPDAQRDRHRVIKDTLKQNMVKCWWGPRFGAARALLSFSEAAWPLKARSWGCSAPLLNRAMDVPHWQEPHNFGSTVSRRWSGVQISTCPSSACSVPPADGAVPKHHWPVGTGYRDDAGHGTVFLAVVSLHSTDQGWSCGLMALEEQGSSVGPEVCGGGSLSCLRDTGRCCPHARRGWRLPRVSARLSANFAREKGGSNRTQISPSGLQYGDAGDASTPAVLIPGVGCGDLIFRLFGEILEQPPDRALLGEEQAGFRLDCGVPRRDYRVWWLVASRLFQGQIPNS